MNALRETIWRNRWTMLAILGLACCIVLPGIWRNRAPKVDFSEQISKVSAVKTPPGKPGQELSAMFQKELQRRTNTTASTVALVPTPNMRNLLRRTPEVIEQDIKLNPALGGYYVDMKINWTGLVGAAPKPTADPNSLTFGMNWKEPSQQGNGGGRKGRKPSAPVTSKPSYSVTIRIDGTKFPAARDLELGASVKIEGMIKKADASGIEVEATDLGF